MIRENSSRLVEKFVLLFLLLMATAMASLQQKSAMFYYGKNISYPMVGVHDYIVLNPKNVNTYRHGFTLYGDQIYAKVNTFNVDDLIELGYKNFFFDMQTTGAQLNSFHKKYPQIRVMVRADFKRVSHALGALSAVVVEGEMINNTFLDMLEKSHIDVIQIEHQKEWFHSQDLVREISQKGVIPFVTNSDFSVYGLSSKNAIKREIFTLIDERKYDRMIQSSHQHGALVLEYMGYIQKIHTIADGLPSMQEMCHYAGVVIWMMEYYEQPKEIITWVKELEQVGVKVAFVGNFGGESEDDFLAPLGIHLEGMLKERKKIIQKDAMISYEIEPSLSAGYTQIVSKNIKPLLIYENSDGSRSTPAAITSWGGYAVFESSLVELNGNNLWVINPFQFFKEALRLEDLVVPDVTTKSGKRVSFTHVDGDGIMDLYEGDRKSLSSEIVFNEIIKKYKIPHSISIIGAEVYKDGLYPKLSNRVLRVVKKIYKEKNVEAVSHTFTHPFKWSKIKNDTLDAKYRLNPKGYKFSMYEEIDNSLNRLNALLPSKKKRADTIYWSGDCMPTAEELEYLYKRKIYNMNGGDTIVSNGSPWLSNIAPLGVEKGGYIQIYTGAQNENIYTNDWSGPFWGYKRVVQTFKLTNSPRRFKPIDVYYHMYICSKEASYKSLKYVFDWLMLQDTIPLYTSEYIKSVMDFYEVSIAQEGRKFLVAGMKNLKTVRLEKRDASMDLEDSPTVVGLKHFENHTYIALDQHTKHIISLASKHIMKNYLVSANAHVRYHKKEGDDRKMLFEGNVDLKVELNVERECRVLSRPKESKRVVDGKSIYLEYKNRKKAIVNIVCGS